LPLSTIINGLPFANDGIAKNIIPMIKAMNWRVFIQQLFFEKY